MGLGDPQTPEDESLDIDHETIETAPNLSESVAHETQTDIVSNEAPAV